MSIISNEERGWAFVHYAFVLARSYVVRIMTIMADVSIANMQG